MGGKSGGGNFPDPFPANIEDVRQLAKLQERFGQRAMRFSAPFSFFDRVGPTGSVLFKGKPGSENFRMVTRLPKAQRQMMRRQEKLQGKLQRTALKNIKKTARSLRKPILGPGALTRSAADVEQATFDRAENLLAPQFEQAQDKLENSLVQRGIPRGSEAYNEAMDNLDRQQSSALENLALSSVGAGRQEQSRLLSSDIARRGATLQQLGAMGVPGIQMPQAPNLPGLGMSAPNISQLSAPLSQAGLAGLNAQAQANAAGKGGLFGLGAAGIGAMPWGKWFG